MGGGAMRLSSLAPSTPPEIHNQFSPKAGASHHSSMQNVQHYESLYNDSLVQLQEATFQLAPS